METRVVGVVDRSIDGLKVFKSDVRYLSNLMVMDGCAGCAGGLVDVLMDDSGRGNIYLNPKFQGGFQVLI